MRVGQSLFFKSFFFEALTATPQCHCSSRRHSVPSQSVGNTVNDHARATKRRRKHGGTARDRRSESSDHRSKRK
ncbi:hypothetical protein C8F04DRAFT_1102353 [Mycena alexandri]|uniref:Uncharacterized protein n=1 Tax=Mycena alexandri TaxID=1745969 RepID=A0AAD6X2E3_9AGAR|nr:hypothetical protein C8F04DRAFT_1102353 [Mycena alexandri]